MFLSSITLRQFRNHRDLRLEIDPKLNLLIGPNGSGKTNIIEAIAVLTTGFSPRGASPDHLIEWGENGFYISGVFGRDEEKASELTLEMKFVDGQRQIKQGGQTSVRLRNLIGMVPLVSFFPEDLSIVKGDPDGRRRALNLVLMQIDPLYAENLRRFTETLRSRNAALKQLAEGRISEDALDPWDEELLKYGLPICEKRNQFLKEFTGIFSQIQSGISNGSDSSRLEYKPSLPGPWDGGNHDRLLRHLRLTRQKDVIIGTTMAGPHRDDISFFLNDKSARIFGSEGQMRTCAVAFKLGEVEIIRRMKGTEPICLLDDVLSELDEGRARRLLEELTKTGQCFVTMTGLESWPQDNRPKAAIFCVSSEGKVEPAKYNKSVKFVAPF